MKKQIATICLLSIFSITAMAAAPLPAMNDLMKGIPTTVTGGGTRGILPPAEIKKDLNNTDDKAPCSDKQPCNKEDIMKKVEKIPTEN